MLTSVIFYICCKFSKVQKLSFVHKDKHYHLFLQVSLLWLLPNLPTSEYTHVKN